MLTAAIAAGALAGGAILWGIGQREHRAALAQRAALLDEAATLFPGCRVTHGPDGFPAFSAVLPDGELAVSLLADTLVTRRLPQLWLVLTLRERQPVRGFSLGALARPTGAEFYALTPGLPDWIAPPAGDVPLLVRGRDLAPESAGSHAAVLGALFAEPELKEAAVTPRGVRVVRQACQGERGAHLLLRQARFATGALPASLVAQALAEARALGAALREPAAVLGEAA